MDLEKAAQYVNQKRSEGQTDSEIRSTLAFFGEDLVWGDIVARAEERAQAERDRWSADGGFIGAGPSENVWFDPPQSSSRWEHVRTELLSKSHMDTQAVDIIDDYSNRIVGLLANPATQAFDTRGLVLGYVQSGKTTNFTAVVSKAADVGYRLVIILAGVTNNLRLQTQKRLIKDLGIDGPEWLPLTNENGDFTSQTASPSQLLGRNECAIAVIKKHQAPMGKLRDWLDQNQGFVEGVPVLIIDDEADQASPNAGDPDDDTDRKTINRLVLRLAGLKRAAYLGYTATPFANLLASSLPSASEEAHDIYPKDFIISLPKPRPPYFGTEDLFGTSYAGDGRDGADILRTVSQAEAMAWNAGIHHMPRMLKTAFRYFILATAAKRARGIAGNSTMLVHTSGQTAQHADVMPLLEAEVAELARRHDDPDLRRELSDLWQLERDRFNPTGRTVEGFADLEQHISSVIQDLEVIQENSYSEKRLSYSEDEDVEDVLVVVGGNTLSRGLTLEGLICSYFLRSAKTYDALLQMGRWFGYREDYEDLPRIWTTGEIRRHFKHLATVEADLRQEIEILQRDPDLDPETMSLRILSDPNGKLDPTSRNKMQASTGIKADYGDRVRVTTHFDVSNREALTDVLTNASSFLAGLAVDSQVLTVDDTGRDGANSVVIANVGHQEIVEYLRSYPFHSEEGSMRPLLGYLEERQKLTWNVAVFSSSGASRNSVDLGVGSFRCWSRPPEAGCPANDTDLGVLRNAKQDEWIDLSTITGEPHDAGEARDLRNARQEALLGFFPVDKDSQPQDSKSTTRERLEAPENLLGLMLAFPRWHDGKGYRKRRNRFSTKPQTQ